jgi:S-formylglutathione hydrolase FrmB
MGGYGAVMLALRHPEMFAAGCSHSGALAFAEYDAPEGAADVVAVLTDALDRETYSCFALAETVERRGPVPTLRIDCGTDDFLIEHSRGLHAHLDAIGVGHEYAEHPGAHNWTYWDRHIPDTLEFILPILGIEGSLTP